METKGIMNKVSSFFKVKERGSTVRTEAIAGLTTFMTMAYILAVNPIILSATGMDAGAIFSATALSAAIATLVMALYANLPIGLAPGMGLNAFFAYSVVLGMGYSWEFALTAVFLEGLIFILLTLTNVREAIMNCIPMELKKGIAAGIGLFIAFIGLQSAGIIVSHDATLVTMGKLNTPTAVVTIAGFFAMGIMLHYKIKGALLYGILFATILGIPLGVTLLEKFDTSLLFNVASLEPTFLKFDFSQVFTADMLFILATFLFIDLFDTVGILVGVGAKSNLLDNKGHLPNVKEAFMADAIGTSVGAMLGTSTVTSYIESAAGVAVGGRTGLASLVVSGLFVLALFLSPIFLLVPAQAAAPVLVIVGLMMFSEVKGINFDNYTVSIPVFVTFIGMPLTYSIAHGIAWGIVSFVVLSLFGARIKNVHPLMIILALLFILKFTFA